MENAQPPAPRRPILDPGLTRPRWIEGQPRSTKLVWLDKNENLDPELLAYTTSLLRSLDVNLLCTYPECAPLYHKLAKFDGVPAESLLLTAGSDGAIRAVFETYVNEGDVVLHTAPTFAMYSVYCKMFGASEIAFEYDRKEDRPHLDFERFLKVITDRKPRVVCLPNPDSPTGTVLSDEQMAELLKSTAASGSLLLIDEAYYPFFENTAARFVKDHSHLVVARTFAKAWGLSGLRVGYLIAAPQVANYLHKVRPMYEVNTLAVGMMERMLDAPDEMRKSVARLQAGKQHFLDSMSALNLKVLRGEGNFMHVAFGPHQAQVFNALKDRVLFRHDFKEPCLQGYSRFSSTTKEIFQPIIEVISATVRNGQAERR